MSKIASVMTRNVKSLDPRQTVGQAARAMRDIGVESMPVCEDGKLVGMLTAKDIVSRIVAAGKSPEDLSVESLMSSDLGCVVSHEDLDDVLIEMSQTHTRQMPVVDGQMRLVGIVSLGDIEKGGQDSDDAPWDLAWTDASKLAQQRVHRATKLKIPRRQASLVH